MAIALSTITSGYNISMINSNFVKLQDMVNNHTLLRDSLGNSMSQDLDMNNYNILNYKSIQVKPPVYPNDIVRLRDLQAQAALLQTQISNIVVNETSGIIGYLTLALLNADLYKPASTIAIVTNDTTTANNTSYTKVGPSGSGSWLPAIDRITNLTNSLASSTGSTTIGYLAPGTGTVARTAADKMSEHKSVFDFLTLAQRADVIAGTLTLDCSVSINNAIAAYTGMIFFPSGNYRIDNPIQWTKSNVTLQGRGEGKSTITATFSTGDMITIGNGTANPNNCGIQGFTIATTVARTAGSCIRFRNGHNLWAESIQIGYNQANGIQFDGGTSQFIYRLSKFEINSGINGIIVGGDGTFLQDVFIDTGIIANTTSNGILMLVCSGFYFRSVDIVVCANSVTISPGASQAVSLGWFDMILADTSTNNGWNLAPTNASGKISDIHFNQCWASSAGTLTNGYGMLFDGTIGIINGLHLVGLRILNNRANGLYMLGAGLVNVYITDPMIECNSTLSVGGFDGMRVGAGVSRWSVIGGVIGLAGGFATNNQRYGIEIDTGASTQYSIIGVNLAGNQTGSMFDGGTGLKTILGCAGYVTKATGTASIVGITGLSVVVNHGLNGTPTIAKVTPAGDPGQRWWVSAITSTSFTINLAAINTLATSYYWEADIANN